MRHFERRCPRCWKELTRVTATKGLAAEMFFPLCAQKLLILDQFAQLANILRAGIWRDKTVALLTPVRQLGVEDCPQQNRIIRLETCLLVKVGPEGGAHCDARIQGLARLRHLKLHARCMGEVESIQIQIDSLRLLDCHSGHLDSWFRRGCHRHQRGHCCVGCAESKQGCHSSRDRGSCASSRGLREARQACSKRGFPLWGRRGSENELV
mmetsp:Transcript_48236/g.88555  ORF Transcript_48236/g.88555 Transcript_48236/m.88555 type:complete len:210 (-) Transcript_48236:1105-1734(-)